MTKSEIVSLPDNDAGNERKVLNIAVAATFTAEPVEHYINWWCSQFGLDTDVSFAPYNQVFQQLLDETSLLSLNDGVNILFVRFEDWLRIDRSGEREQIEKLESNFNNLIEIITRKKKDIPYFIGILPVSDQLCFSPGVLNYIGELYGKWTSALQGMENVHIIDCRALGELYNIDEVFDSHKDAEAHMPFSDMYYGALGTVVARKICAWNKQHFKVIVLDCDNTLWRGICGEDGALGVSVDESFGRMQEFLLERCKEGMLLAICSKNNEADVWEVFDKNPGMVLKKEHFVSRKINWQPKSANIRKIAEELNLGTDSFIFIDDSPAECTEVMTNLPEVLTLKLPEDTSLIPAYLYHTWAFDRFKVTEEDTSRTKMYLAEQQRKNTHEDAPSLDGFIKGLELKMSMNRVEDTRITRAAQLTNKTNQFNLSVIRRTEEELKQLIGSPGYMCHVIEVSDRFGDYGLVGVVITKKCGTRLFIDTLLLSCRVLGRRIEDAILVGLKKLCSETGACMLEADFRPTGKNMPVRGFLERTGWRNVEENEGCVKFVLEAERIPDREESVDCLYNSRFESAEAAETVVEAEQEEYTLSYGKPDRKHDGRENIWSVMKVNWEKLVHKSYLIPLENPSGKELMKLPVAKNARNGLTPALESVKREEYVPPGNKLEKLLAGIWQEVLGVNNIGINDRFFDIGGDSIKAVYISKECAERGVKVSANDIFTYRTISEISENIKIGDMENIRFDVGCSGCSTLESGPKANETGVSTLRKLKINPQREITTYLHRSLPLCAILAHDEYLPWFYRHYIQIFSVTYNNGFSRLEFLEPKNCYDEIFDEVYLKYEDMADIIGFIEDKISSGCYISVHVDEYRLPQKSSYMKNHFVHPSLIYGYDSVGKKLLAVGFDSEMMFMEITFDYDDFMKAYEEAKLFYRESAPWAETEAIQLLKPKELNGNYPFDLNRFLEEVNNYMHSSAADSGRINKLVPPGDMEITSDIKYGLEVYGVVVSCMEKLGADILGGLDVQNIIEQCREKVTADIMPAIDYRSIHLLYEHKRCLYNRLKYIIKRYDVPESLSILTAGYLQLVESLNTARLTFFDLEHMFRTGMDVREINFDNLICSFQKMVETVRRVGNRETELLGKIYEELKAVALCEKKST